MVKSGTWVPVQVLNPAIQWDYRIASLAEVEELGNFAHVSGIQNTESVPETALWQLVKESSLGLEKHKKLFSLLMHGVC